MKIEHKIIKSLNPDLITAKAMLAFDKYSIVAHNDYYKEERAMRCMEVVLRSIEIGLLNDEDIDRKAEILDNIIADVDNVINNVKRHLQSNTKFGTKLYSIDLSKFFDTSDKDLFNTIEHYLNKVLSRRHLAVEYICDRIYVYGWHKVNFFDNKYTQKKINSLCEDVAGMIAVEKYINDTKVENNGYRHIKPTPDIPILRIEACARLNNMRYSTYTDYVEIF